MANRVEASETTEREIDIAVREIVVKPFHRATEMLRAPRANLAEGARLLLAQETGDRRSIPCDPLDRCEGSTGRARSAGLSGAPLSRRRRDDGRGLLFSCQRGRVPSPFDVVRRSMPALAWRASPSAAST